MCRCVAGVTPATEQIHILTLLKSDSLEVLCGRVRIMILVRVGARAICRSTVDSEIHSLTCTFVLYIYCFHFGFGNERYFDTLYILMFCDI
ncbi:hypothetical protein Sjap_026555 [Stephania japonica]|uniref:Uncharacterized protein n=1 Tax=Stephania japonica TaxID=461633 RepID=A0AAP0HGJ5_9MAGN